jgi:membrane protein DedA with SNARE-associated domain
MDVAWLISHYGLVAVFAGAMLEGETLLLVAGYAAHRGYLPFDAVVAAAWAGAVSGDQLFFALGRRHGHTLMARRPALAARLTEALGLIDRHSAKIALVMRFLWGWRTVLPIALGMSHVSRARFVAFDLIAGLAWAALVAAIGYFFGALIARHAASLHRYEHWGIAFVLFAAALWHAGAWWRRRARARAPR